MPARRDMTKKQFESALKRHGFKRCPYMGGYYDLGDGLNANARNGGPQRRDQLAYLIRTKRKYATA